MYIGQFDDDSAMKNHKARLDTFKNSKWPFSYGTCTPDKVKNFMKYVIYFFNEIFRKIIHVAN